MSLISLFPQQPRRIITPTPTYPLREMLVGAYSFDASNGADLSGNGRHLTAVNSPTFTTGVSGNCAVFDAASSQYFSLADGTPFLPGTSDFWVCGYVYLAAGTNDKGIAGVWTPAGNQRCWGLWTSINQTAIRLVVSRDGTNLTYSTASVGSLSQDAWHWVVAWRAGGTIYCSVDNGTPASAAIASGPIAVTSAFTVGTFANAYLPGRLDEITVGIGTITPHLTWLQNSGDGRSALEIYNYEGA